MKKTLTIACWISVIFLFDTAIAQLNQNRPAILDEVGVNEKPGDTIPLDLRFANSQGDSVSLADLIESGKPVLLNPLYYECPVLCSLVSEAVFQVVEELSWSPGKDYTIISFSIDPAEEPEVAASAKKRYLDDLNRPGAEEGWHFLTGNETEIKKLTESVGFSYKYDEKTSQYIHPASIMMISPDGVITRYLYGAVFKEFDVRNALYEAADGTIGTTLDRVVLNCFTYDPASQSYVPVAINIMKLGGLATAIILGIFLSVFWRRERGSSQSPKIDLEK